jgi:exodeoxyribonuclease VII small subunit
VTDHEAGNPTGDRDEALSLEGRLRRLEEIMGQLEADEVDVEKALALFEEGVGHVRAAERILAETELRVEELLSSGESKPLVEEDDG